MKATYTFREDEHGSLIIDEESDCGRRIPAIGMIMGPRSPQPSLSLRKPVGLWGIDTIIQQFKEWQEFDRVVQANAEGEEARDGNNAKP